MISRSIIIGVRDTQYKDREVYRVAGIGEFTYKYRSRKEVISTGHNESTIGSEIKFKCVKGKLDDYCDRLLEYKSLNGSFIIVDSNLNRIGGDHCIRLKDVKDKFTLDLQEIRDTEVINKCDLLDYGIYQYVTKKVKDVGIGIREVCNVEHRTAMNVCKPEMSSNMINAWVENDTLMVELKSRLLPELGSFLFAPDGLSYLSTSRCCTERMISLWYRIKCTSVIGGIPSKVIYNRECYVVDLDKLNTVVIDKEFMSRNLKRIRYLAIGGKLKDTDGARQYYDLEEQRVVDLDNIDTRRDIATPLECLSENFSLEYIPLPDGKFVNIEGNIITHQEMEEYFMNKYGYFIDLYNVYRITIENNKEYAGLYSLNYSDFEDIRLFRYGELLSSISRKEIGSIGIIGDTYTEICNLKVKNELLFKGNNNLAWVAVESMRGNEIEIRNGVLIQCKVNKDLSIRDIRDINCCIEVIGAEVVNIDIYGDFDVHKCYTRGKCNLILHSYSSFKRLNDYTYRSTLAYQGEDYIYALEDILLDKWDYYVSKMSPRNNLKIKGEWQLGYRDTYKVIAHTIQNKEDSFTPNKSLRNSVMLFIDSILSDEDITDNINRDAIRDILVDYTSIKYTSRKG